MPRVPEMTTIQATSLFLPAVNALLKDPDALDPASREALDAIRRDRWIGKIEDIGKYMGKNLFGSGGLLGGGSTALKQTASDGRVGGGGAGGGGGGGAAAGWGGTFGGGKQQK